MPLRVRLVFKAPREAELADVEDRRIALADEFHALPSQHGAFAPPSPRHPTPPTSPH